MNFICRQSYVLEYIGNVYAETGGLWSRMSFVILYFSPLLLLIKIKPENS